MSFLAADAIWTAIKERVDGTNTIAPRAMPAAGSNGHIVVDRNESADVYQQANRALYYANASIRVEPDRSPNTTPEPSTRTLLDLRVVITITYVLEDATTLAPARQAVKSMAIRHYDMLQQALCYPGTLAVTTAAGVAWDGSTLNSGTATGLVSGCLFPASPGLVVTKDAGDDGADLYETEITFRGTANVSAAVT